MPSELAYVFWQWPRSGVSSSVYEKKLWSFQSALKVARPDLVTDLLTYQIDSLPWGPKDAPLYEDWYLVDDFADLGSLNDAAVAGGIKGAHDSVAGDYLKGSGGVFKRVLRNLPLDETRHVTWIEKDIGVAYQSYYDEVANELGSRETDLWRRQMVLGPSPQFCVHSADPVEFPDSFHPLAVKARAVGHSR